MRHMPYRLATVTAIALLLLLPAGVLAHAELDVPTPADGATVEGTPDTVEGTFTQDMRSEGSSLQLRDAAGTLVGEGGVDEADPRRMAIDSVPELAPGEYEVRWTTFSAEDGEGPIRGTWTFTVTAAPTPEPTPEPTATAAASAEPSATPEPTPGPTVAPTPSPSDDGDGDPAATEGDVLLPILAALAIVAVAGVLLMRRRGQATGA
jgi:methionine-rich copper-binding protein CopC